MGNSNGRAKQKLKVKTFTLEVDARVDYLRTEHDRPCANRALITSIWELAETGAASTKQIADRLSVAPASVTNMLGRLRERGLVDYEPYHGALLTRRGREEALRLVRCEREAGHVDSERY